MWSEAKNILTFRLDLARTLLKFGFKAQGSVHADTGETQNVCAI